MSLSALDQVSIENGRLQQSPQPPPRHEPGHPPEPVHPNPWHDNVHPAERAASCLLGGSLVGLGVSHPTPLRLLGAIAGTLLVGRGLSGHCGGYSLLHYSTAKSRPPAPPEAYYSGAIHLESAVTVNRPAAELYAFWRKFENLPKFMANLESVTELDDKRSHWITKAPAGTSVQWEAEIISDEPDRLIAWRSLGNADVDNAGSVRFVEAPGNRGTEVRVVIDYLPPAGRLGAAVAKLFGTGPQAMVKEDLRRLKQLMEAGELPTTLGQPSGRGC